MFEILAGVLVAVISWQLSRRFMRWQISREVPAIADVQTVDRETLYRVAEECTTFGWRAAMNGFSINYFKETEDRPWYAGYFKTVIHNREEHVFYMKEYTVEGGLVDISATVTNETLRVPSYLPEGEYR